MYYDCYVAPIKKERLEEYKDQSERWTRLWIEHGALGIIEAEADNIPVGEVTSFPRATKMEDDETLIIGFVTYASREHRDKVVEGVFSDTRMINEPPIFDGKRMIFGSFQEKLNLKGGL